MSSRANRKVKPVHAGGYLMDALDSVRRAGNVEGLYDPDIRADRLDIDRPWVAHLAARRRMSHSRTAMLLAALSAEAYINEFLQAKLPAAAWGKIDRKSTMEKYKTGPMLAIQRDLFVLGEDPLQSLRALFRLRNRLAHPRQASGLEPPANPREAHPILNPERATSFILQVACAANQLVTEGRRRTPDRHAISVMAAAQELRRFARSATGDLPGPTVVHDDAHDAIFVALSRMAEVVLPEFDGYRVPPHHA